MRHCRCLLALSLLSLTPFGVSAPNQPAATQRNDDPLPKGAIARMGLDRWPHNNTITEFVEFLPDGKTVVTVTYDNLVRLWEFPSGKEISRWAVDRQKKDGGISDAVLSSDFKTIAICGISINGNEFSFHDLTTGKELAKRIKLLRDKKMPEPQETIPAFSPDGKHFAYITKQGKLVIWDWRKGEEVAGFAAGNPVGFPFTHTHPLVVYSPNGRFLATSVVEQIEQKQSTFIRIWDCATGKEVAAIRTDADRSHYNSIALSPDGKVLAHTTGKKIVLLDSSTGKSIREMVAKKETTTRWLRFSKDGTRLYTTSEYRNKAVNDFEYVLIEWDVATGVPLREAWMNSFSRRHIALTPDGSKLAVATIGPQFFDISAGKDMTAINRTNLEVVGVQFSLDGKELLTVGSHGKRPRQVRNWDVATGKELGPIKLPFIVNNLVSFHDLHEMALSPNGKTLAAIVNDDPAKPGSPAKVVLVDLATGKATNELARSTQPYSQSRLSACFSQDGKMIAATRPAESKIDVFDSSNAKLLVTITGIPGPNRVVSASHPEGERTTLFSPDGKMIACFARPQPKQVGFFDAATGKPFGSLPLPTEPKGTGQQILNQAAFSPDGRCLALETDNGTFALYELASGQRRGTFGKEQGKNKRNEHVCFAFSPNGKSFAYSGFDAILRIYDVATCTELTTFQGHSDSINAIAFSPDGKMLASGSDDSTALVWDVSKLVHPSVAAKEQQPADFENNWKTLAEADAGKAFEAIRAFAATPNKAVSFLKPRLKPEPPLDDKRVALLLTQLDSDQYQLRQKASDELLKTGLQLVPALDKALAGNPSLETKRRLEELRGKLTAVILQGDLLRAYRAVEILELIGTPESREVLRPLAEGAPGAVLTLSAQAALKR